MAEPWSVRQLCVPVLVLWIFGTPAHAQVGAGALTGLCPTEVFNVTNTPPLGAPNGVVGSAVFGSITSAGDPRVVQLALKFVF
jgi:hypothetical protein